MGFRLSLTFCSAVPIRTPGVRIEIKFTDSDAAARLFLQGNKGIRNYDIINSSKLQRADDRRLERIEVRLYTTAVVQGVGLTTGPKT